MKTFPSLSSFGRIGMLASVVAAFVVTTGCSSSSGKRSGSRDGLLEGDMNANREARFGGNSIPSGDEDGPYRNVYFDYDSSGVSSEGRNDIEANAELLKETPDVKVVLEGHTDERGTEEYNLQLGQARARSVRDYLVSLGVSPSRVETISYGENIPAVQGASEDAWSKNRRVHFSGTTTAK